MRPAVVAVVIFLTSLLNLAASERILVVTPLGTKSHKNVFDPLLRALGERGHEVTVIANTKSSNLGDNVTEYVPLDFNKFIGRFPNGFERRRAGWLSSFWDWGFVNEMCHEVFQDSEFNRLMRGKYDLVIFNAYMNVCFQGYLPSIGAPYILLTSMAAPNTITTKVGNWLPPSFVPNPFFPFSERMNFFERLANFIFDGFFLYSMPTFDAHTETIYRKYLGESTPGIEEIGKNVSLIFMNSYLNFPSPRPVLPDVIEVGGMHCVPAKPLPRELEDFVSGAEDGFIFFSFGSVVKSKDLDSEYVSVFTNVFSRLKQRVLWKWDEEIKDLAPNVKIGKWLPQQDILGHKNIRLFITHGGLLSTQEAIYHGVPLLGMPIFIDQDLNMKQAEAAGFAVTVEVLNITEAKFEAALQRALNDDKLAERAKYLSSAFKDQLQTPVERAVFWVEYVIRHKGAAHLRSAARKLNFFQYHSLDVVAILGLILLLSSATLFLILRKCLGLIGLIKNPVLKNLNTNERAKPSKNVKRRKAD